MLHIFHCACRISTSGLKSDVTIVFLNPDLLKDTKVSAICVHLTQIKDYLIFAWILRTSQPKMEVLRDKIGEGVVRYWPPKKSLLLFGVLTSVPILAKIDKKCNRESVHRRTHRLTDVNRLYNLSHAICYSYGADNNQACNVIFYVTVNAQRSQYCSAWLKFKTCGKDTAS